MVSQTFLLRHQKPEIGLTMVNVLGVKPTKGDIGIEVEVEGNKFNKTNPIPYWTYHKDNSLRGHDNAEYVLTKPIKFDQVPDSLAVLWGMFNDYGSILDVSNRTSVHIHLNVQNFFLNRLTAFMALYFSVEELLAQWCGEHRVGNLFCLRARDATAIVSELKKFIQSSCRSEMKDGMHYAGFNAGALLKFGSIEIRTLRGVTDPQTILDWVGMLRNIYELSDKFQDPREIPGLMSSEGPMNYIDLVLGDKSSILKNGINYSVHQLRESIYNGIRLAQDLCYCRDWSLYSPTEVKKDPFGRSLSSVATSLGNAEAAPVGLSVPVIGGGLAQALDHYQFQSQNIQLSQSPFSEAYTNMLQNLVAPGTNTLYYDPAPLAQPEDVIEEDSAMPDTGWEEEEEPEENVNW